jgi:non-canonical (house-cleaning) NTP pyrophosphatase
MEMGPANDQVSGEVNSKQAGGVAGKVTDQLITREDITYIAAVLAFSQLKNKHFYEDIPNTGDSDK